MVERPLIAAVHFTPASIPPLRSVLADELPNAQMWNVIDDRPGPDADALGGLAQYSLSPAADELAAKIGLPMASPTRSAARAIARRLGAP